VSPQAAESSVAEALPGYLPALRRYFRRRAPGAEVEDLVQDVCLGVQARRAQGEIENLEAYLFTVARHVLSEHARRSARRVDVQADLELEAFGDPEPRVDRQLLDREALKSALQALEEMSERTQAIFVMHRFEEMTYSAIARRSGISVSAVEKHMMSALRILQDAAGRRR